MFLLLQLHWPVWSKSRRDGCHRTAMDCTSQVMHFFSYRISFSGSFLEAPFKSPIVTSTSLIVCEAERIRISSSQGCGRSFRKLIAVAWEGFNKRLIFSDAGCLLLSAVMRSSRLTVPMCSIPARSASRLT